MIAMCSHIITSKEIEQAERDIFGQGLHFNNEQKMFIRCLDSCCVQAYAGTGKTSAIVGKLHVLAQKNVWRNGKGICIISHTNVAVDEIKKHVARHYPAIMQYPNFVGTIQEFANKFLFIPYLSDKGLHIKHQDEARYFDYKNEIKDQIVVQRIDNKLIQLSNSHNSKEAKKYFFERMRTVHMLDDKLYARGREGEFTECIDLQTKKVPQAKIVEAFHALIQKKHKEGYFLFSESFIYGHKYLEQNQILKDIISQRFQFAFLDEAQDCSEIQLKLLDKLFGANSKTIFQQIGDINQAISETQWKAMEPWLYLGKSMRFGGDITDFINKFRVDSNGLGVTGCDTATKKLLIIFDPGKQKEVLACFAGKIKTEVQPLGTNKKRYFAISHKHVQLKDYFEDYSEKIAKNTNKNISHRFDTDIEYLDLITEDAIKSHGSHFVSTMLFSLLYRHYKNSAGSWSELKELLRNGKKAAAFKAIVIAISNDILLRKCISDYDKLKSDLNGLLGEVVIDFARNGNGKGLMSSSAPIPDNIYVNPDQTIKIKVATIHSVKGQTHDATLLFSNHEYDKQDIKHALGCTPQRTPEYKRLLYVAASRSKSLFAFAIEKNVYNGLTDKSCFATFKQEML